VFSVISGFIKNAAVVKELTNMRYAHEQRINKFKSRCEGFISQIVALAACGHLLVPSSQAHVRKGTLISNSSLVLQEHFPRDDCKHYQQWSTFMKFDSTDESADTTCKIQALRYRIWDLGLGSKTRYKGKIWDFWTKSGLFWDHFGTFLGLFVVILMILPQNNTED
jgi:hypothetical protein